jgi:hypothetical protein
MGFAAIRSGATNLKNVAAFQSEKQDRESRAKAAPAVLEGLKDNEAKLAELRAASKRPHSRYPVVYDLDNPWGILLPHLASVKSVCQRLNLKACAELAAGQSQNALEDVKLILFLADSVKEEPFLISHLVRFVGVQIATQPIWEGLAEHRWSDAHLQALQARLQQYNFLADLKQAMDAERATGILTVDLIRKKGLGYLMAIGDDTEAVLPPPHTPANLISPFIPRGWYYQEQFNYCRLFQEQLGGTFDTTKKRVSPSQVESNSHELEREFAGGKAIIRHHVMARLLLPALGRVSLKATTAQTAADQAALACALERYRLANGNFPEDLNALVPRFISQLPHDALTGEPYKYRSAAHGRFALYSIGWDEKDDGGVPGKVLFDDRQGDWVWNYPAQ